ncbi:MAG: Rrf2 family transcriptional regulator [Proteobacteria bacterium]|nr:Rrf2 family transcriptional regulator [Pseudomonadota bacterium]MCH8976972.1 Rrf2 family transcriptional regulator [Pseudomonadota bacterium]
MKLTTKGRYAVTAMLDLALHEDQAPINLADIAARQHISLAYLEQLFGKLRKKGLVKSVRGPGGGYHLALDADDITPAHVIYAVNEPVDATLCGGQQNCTGDARCLTHDLWMGLNLSIAEYLNGISLGELIRMNNVKQVANKQDAILIQRDIHMSATI